jgi:hypothetical protein
VVRKPTPDTPKGRTLFVLNIPLGGADTLQAFFGQFGTVHAVALQTMSTGSAKKQTLQVHLPLTLADFVQTNVLSD